MKYLVFFMAILFTACNKNSNPSNSTEQLMSYETYDPNPDELVAKFTLLSSTQQNHRVELEVEFTEMIKSGFSAKRIFSKGDKLLLNAATAPPSSTFTAAIVIVDSREKESYRLIRFLK